MSDESLSPKLEPQNFPRATPNSGQDQPITIGILPLVDLSEGAAEGHLCEGLAEEILQGLNKVEGVRVLSRTSTFLYRDAGLSYQEIGKRLGVLYVLTGGLQKGTTRLLLNLELIAVDSGQAIWTIHTTREASELFTLIGELVSGVATALNLVSPGPKHSSLNLEAYDFYLKGRQYYFRFNRHGMAFACEEYQQALAIDPEFAAAWAGLANCAAFLYIYVDRSEHHRAQAEFASRKALELDPDLAEAHVSRGIALSAVGESEEADEAFETALRLDPNLYDAFYFYARHCFAAGKFETAIQFFEWAAALRPEDFQAPLLVAQVYTSLGILDEAQAARRRGLALVEDRLKHTPDDVRARYMGANALVALGEREKGLAWARIARSLDPSDSMLLYNLGCIHALAGEIDDALDCLVQALAAGLSEKAWLIHDADLVSLHEHPRFAELVRSLDD